MSKSKALKICPNWHADLHRILFTENSLKIKKGLELVSMPQFSSKNLHFLVDQSMT